MKFGNIILEDFWHRNAGGWFRCSENWIKNYDASIGLYHNKVEAPFSSTDPTREVYDKNKSHIWTPYFGDKINDLQKIFIKSHSNVIIGTGEYAKSFVDDFLIKINCLRGFL